MNKKLGYALIFFAVICAAIVIELLSRHGRPASKAPLLVGIAPYQDMAMLTVYDKLQLQKKYELSIELKTLAWEDIQSALASAGRTIDVGFGSLIEFLTKYDSLSGHSSDPLVFVFPAYVFKGGGFVTFNNNVPNLDSYAGTPPSLDSIPRTVAKTFLSYRIGAQKNSMWDMMIYQLAASAGVPQSEVKVIDIPAADALLAAQEGSLDLAGAGLTQRNEALERGGRLVFTMDRFGFADITGFICRRSVLGAKRAQIEAFIKLWFDCVSFVQKDIDRNSTIPIQYLDRVSSTKYTVASYKRALESESMPRSVADAEKMIVGTNALYSIGRISKSVTAFLLERGLIHNALPPIQPITIQ